MAPWVPPDSLSDPSIVFQVDATPNLTSRALDNDNVHHLTMAQLHNLHILTVAISGLSLVSGLIAASWFYRMKRSFRHDLIMLLIHCDIFKAVWFLAFPAVDLAYGTIASGSGFCQASGFFLALSIEATDMAVAMIAVHTALYIFRGDQGLYPYRKIAYVVFFTVPTLLSSLAFINSQGYVNTGTFCYLPVAPTWIRRALSWIPRYITFGLILLIYLVIYAYVRILIRRFGKTPKGAAPPEDVSLLDSTNSSTIPRRQTIVPPTPPIACHGLIPSTTASRRTSRDSRGRQFSVISNISTLNIDPPPSKRSSKHAPKSPRKVDAGVAWKMPNFNSREVASSQDSASSETDLRDQDTTHYINGELTLPSEIHVRDCSEPSSSSSNTVTPPTRPSTLTRDRTFSLAEASTALPSRNQSKSHFRSILLRGSGAGIRTGSTPSIFAPGNLDTNTMVKTREKIRRQLRQLFIYPVIYIVCWIVPFIVYLSGYTNGTPYGMVFASLIFLSIQGFVDAVVFSIKEKPWRHPRRKEPCCLCFWKRSGVKSSMNGGNGKVGRTREEMAVDGRQARRRRDRELEDQMAAPTPVRKAPVDWWDHDHHT